MTHVFRWDLDKTYLATEFDSVGDLVRAAFQSAEEKENIPGTAALMRHLKRSADDRIYVVSGSPTQMRRVLMRKLRLDGVQVDRLTLKPNLKNLLRGRFRAVRDQVGYKLPALLESRAALGHGADVRETCFGDDAEMDGLVYALYTDICARRVTGGALDAILRAARLYPDQQSRICAAAAQISPHDPVERIFIHLESGSPLARFEALPATVTPTFNTFQAACVLHGDGRLDLAGVQAVADEMCRAYGYTTLRLESSLADIQRRAVITPDAVARIEQTFGMTLPTAAGAYPRAAAATPDYVALLGELHRFHERDKRERRRRPGIRSLLFPDD